LMYEEELRKARARFSEETQARAAIAEAELALTRSQGSDEKELYQ